MQKVAKFFQPKWLKKQKQEPIVQTVKVMPKVMPELHGLQMENDAGIREVITQQERYQEQTLQNDYGAEDENQLQLAVALSLSLHHAPEDAMQYKDEDQNSLESAQKQYEIDTSCAICFSDMTEDVFMFNCCHIFCYSCCRQHVHIKIEDGIVDILCPLCPQQLSQMDIRQLSDEIAFERWLRLSLAAHLESNRHIYFHCPTLDCPSIVEKTLFDVVQCPLCRKSACSNCYNDHEENVTCEDHQKWREINGKVDELCQERVTQKLLMRCDNCSRFVEKNGGCNNMRVSMQLVQFFFFLFHLHNPFPCSAVAVIYLHGQVHDQSEL